MDVAGLISCYERACEADIERKLQVAEMQLYGEMELAPAKATVRPWEPPSGSGDAIREWRDKFVCLRVVGKAIFPEDKAEETLPLEDASDDDDDFWNATCRFPIPSEGAEAADEDDEFAPVILDDNAVYGRETEPEAHFPEGFEPDLSLCVVGLRPPLRSEPLVEEEEEIVCAEGVYEDYVAVSRWPETEVSADPDDEFPPFEVTSPTEAALRLEAAVREAELYAPRDEDDEAFVE